MEAISTVDPYAENANDLRIYYDELREEYEDTVDEYNYLLTDYSDLELEVEQLQKEIDSLNTYNFNLEQDLKNTSTFFIILLIIIFIGFMNFVLKQETKKGL